MDKKFVLTIGHSNLAMGKFLENLDKYGVEVLVDVRSTPYSKTNPQFNREKLALELNEASIEYVFMGDSLGGRPKEGCCYVGGQASYELMMVSDVFKEGINKLVGLVDEGGMVAMMCSEGDPIDCHRMVLISRVLNSKDLNVFHILRGGNIEKNSEALKRLFRVEGVEYVKENIGEAYKKRGVSVAYKKK